MLRAEVELAWKTKAGHRHQLEGLDNEDAVFVTRDHPLFDALLIVADGMGGHPRPREASETAVQAAQEFLSDPARLESAGDVARALFDALWAAHEAVCRLRNGSSRRAPGTTLSVAAVVEGMLYVAHVGDGSVFLMREGQVRALAGGEERRTGNRPAQFLGQESPLEPEERRISLAQGDRVLLCTDGLTRYFREAGPEALERVVGRQGIEIGSIAAQLTAHSRPDEYDDDTTVALAEVTALTHAPRSIPTPGPRAMPGETRTEESPRETGRKSQPGRRSGLGTALAGMAVGGGLLVLGFWGGRATAPHVPASPLARPQESRRPAAPETLGRLPAGNVVLLDSLGKRVFTLATRSAPLGNEPVELQAFRVSANGRFTEAGAFRLDPAKGVLTDADGRSYPVETDLTRGAIRVLHGGALVVNTRPPKAAVWVDGEELGPSPRQVTLAAGRHSVRVEGRNWTKEAEVEVIPGATVTLSLGP